MWVCLVAQSYPTLCDPMNCSQPVFSAMGILQTRILEWVTMPSSRGSSQSRDWTQVSHIAGGFFTIWATREAQLSYTWFILKNKFPTNSLFPNSNFWSEIFSSVPSVKFCSLQNKVTSGGRSRTSSVGISKKPL